MRSTDDEFYVRFADELDEAMRIGKEANLILEFSIGAIEWLSWHVLRG